MTTTVNSVERAFRILGLFDDGRPEQSISEISRALNIHKSTAHNIAQTLCKLNVLEQNPANLKYHLGSRLASLGNLARQHLDLRQLARPYVESLAREIHVSVFLGVFENDGITIVEKAESPEQLRISAPIGQRVPFCAGSFGRVFLAYMPLSEVDRLINERGLRRFTRTAITDPSKYRSSLAEVKGQGYAVDDTEEYLDGVWAVSAPIFDGDGVAAGLTSVTFKAQIKPKKAGEIIRATLAAAEEVTRRLGGKYFGEAYETTDYAQG
jgi:DNA-binding IclR family transcriptional regulator